MPIHLTPIATGSADGYYCKRSILIQSAGADEVDAEARDDAGALVADESVIQGVLDAGDKYIDGRAYIWGVTQANAPHYIAADDQPLFDNLSYWGSRWARAELYQRMGQPVAEQTADLPGEDLPEADQPSGKFQRMRKEAEKRIDEFLEAKRDRELAQAGDTSATPGIAVGFNACAPRPHGVITPNLMG